MSNLLKGILKFLIRNYQDFPGEFRPVNKTGPCTRLNARTNAHVLQNNRNLTVKNTQSYPFVRNWLVDVSDLVCLGLISLQPERARVGQMGACASDRIRLTYMLTLSLWLTRRPWSWLRNGIPVLLLFSFFFHEILRCYSRGCIFAPHYKLWCMLTITFKAWHLSTNTTMVKLYILILYQPYEERDKQINIKIYMPS